MPSDVFSSDEGRQRVAQSVATIETILERFAEIRALQVSMLQDLQVLAPESELRVEAEAAALFVKPQVLNALELSALFRLEALCLVQDYHLAVGARRSMYARLVLLSLYESMRTLRVLLGKAFRDEMIDALGLEVRDKLNIIGRSISTIFDRVNSEFGGLRNELVGHRSADAMSRLYHLSNTDEEAIIRMAVEAFTPLNNLNLLYVPYLDRGSEILRAQRQRVDACLRQPKGPSGPHDEPSS